MPSLPGACASALLALAGLINLYPVVGMLGVEQLRALYGVGPGDPDLALLLRHRAILLGLLGTLLLAAAFRRRLQPLAVAAGLISMLSFIALALPLAAHGAAMARIVWADVLACALLLCATVLRRDRQARPATGR